MVVVDESVLVPALADGADAGRQARERLRGEVLHAPEVIDLEVASALRGLLRRGLVSRRGATAVVAQMGELPLQRARHAPLLARCWELRDNMTPYDASYVALAEALDVTLVTADERLAAAPGIRCRVDVLTLPDSRH